MRGPIITCHLPSGDPFAERVLDAIPAMETVLVPALWRLEVVNVLLAAERRGRTTRALALRFLENLRSLPIRVESSEESSPMEALLRLAADRGLTAYDAAYLDCAARKGLAMATLDERLRKCCRDAAVELYA